jgi:glutathionylspermidine synthase
MTALESRGVATPIAYHPALRAAEPLTDSPWQAIRRQMLLAHCKWDPQIGDVQTLSPFPLILAGRTWHQLAGMAESAARELMSAERELIARPDLHRPLGVPRAVSKLLAETGENFSCGPRLLRFDFHPTDRGWRLSEVNSDVPGGYTEASSFTRLMAEHYPGTQIAGDVGAQWADAIAAATVGPPTVALLYAAGFLEDLQVVAYLAHRLEERGLRPMLAQPRQVRFRGDRAFLQSGAALVPLGAIVRFFQAEWLASRRVSLQWRSFFRPCRTPIVNSPAAILTESKRLPLVWDRLRTAMPTWRTLLPETRCPRKVPMNSGRWLLKTAYCNNGDTVSMREMLPASQWRRTSIVARLFPGQWIAQRRFESLPIESPAGSIFPCLGVYTVDGRAAGIYARYAHRPLIDYTAVDLAVLIENREGP